MIDWDPRSHPFYYYPPLIQFVLTQGLPDFEFDISKTLITLELSNNLESESKLLSCCHVSLSLKLCRLLTADAFYTGRMAPSKIKSRKRFTLATLR